MTANSDVISTQSAIPTGAVQHSNTPSRRELLFYAWGAALTLVGIQSAAAGFLFLRPRFRPGDFGGEFSLGDSSRLPAIDAAPKPIGDGKFWLVNTSQGPKAIYMVCTHLGCLYKWEDSLGKFRCPCHNSEFSREGELLKGPAARALDQFVVKVVLDERVVAESSDNGMWAVPPLIADPQSQIVVDTGRKIMGR